jgi:DNA-binding CsgD family transcriptional regulator
VNADADPVSIKELSRRETEIVSLAASGLTDKEIGVQLGISYGTVNTHWSRIRPKMNVSNRSEAVSRYVQAHAQRKFGELASENVRLTAELNKREVAAADQDRHRQLLDALAAKLQAVVWSVGPEGRPDYFDGAANLVQGLDPRRFLDLVAPAEARNRAIGFEPATTEVVVGASRFVTQIHALTDGEGLSGYWGISSESSWAADLDSEVRQLAHAVANGVPCLVAVLDFGSANSVWLNEYAGREIGSNWDKSPYISLRKARALLHPTDRKRFRLMVRASRNAERPISQEAILRIGNAKEHRLRVMARFVAAGPATATGSRYVVVVAQELTAACATPRDVDIQLAPLREALVEMREVVEEFPTGLMLVDHAQRLLQVSQVAGQIWAHIFEDKECLGALAQGRMRDPFTGRQLLEHEWPHVRALGGQTVRLQLLDVIDCNGSRKRILCTATPVRDEAGSVIAAALTLADLTQLPKN